MDGVDAEAPRGVARVLVGVAAALGGAALCVLLGAGSAQADTTSDAGSTSEGGAGLLSSTLTTVSATVQSIDSAMAPLRTAAPAPAATASAAPRGAVQSAVAPVVSAIDSTVAALPVVSTVVRELAGPTPIAEVTEPVASLLDTAIGTGAGVVGPTAGAVSRELVSSTDQVDHGPAGAITPALRAGKGIRAAGVLITGPAASVVAVSSSAGALARSLTGWPAGLTDSGIPSPVSSTSGSTAGSAAMLGGALVLALTLLALRRRGSRFAAPSAPVFDTDSSPD